MLRRIVFPLSLLPLIAPFPAGAAESVALRATNGRFLRVGDDGLLRAVSFLPAEKETFELVSRGDQRIALKGPGGRYLVADANNARGLRLGAAAAAAGDRETFQLLPAAENRFVLRPLVPGVPPALGSGEPRPPAQAAFRPRARRVAGNLPRPAAA